MMTMVTVNEMIIEDLKNIESSSELLLEALTEIKKHIKQALQNIKPPNEPKQSEPPKYYGNGQAGPWSNALREKYMKAQREKHGIKMREGYE
jgi:hypothetical protein